MINVALSAATLESGDYALMVVRLPVPSEMLALPVHGDGARDARSAAPREPCYTGYRVKGSQIRPTADPTATRRWTTAPHRSGCMWIS